jgi:hypothetical protein
MRETRLIFIDGLPGSGKSTTAEYLASELQQRGIPHRLFREREADHPLNVGGELHPSGSTTGTGMFAAYTVASFIDESLDRWRAFVANAATSERVTVLDSHPFQNSVRVLAQMDADPTVVTAYQTRVHELVAALAPVLIYLDAGDAERAIRAIAAQRGPAWSDYAVAVATDCPYASSRGLAGMDGAVAVLRAYKALLDESVVRFPFAKLVLSHCDSRWPDCHAEIRTFLDLDAPVSRSCIG